ncbi:hypothetical protein [Chryseobacterium viscerum]|nr:hypothetical protein [Chryseobacterium viscerum]
MKLLIPQNIKQKVCELSKLEHPFKFKVDMALYLLNLIIFSYFGKDFQDGDYLSLSSRILEKNAGKGYNKHLDLFVKKEIIDKLFYSTHETKGHCNLFKLNEKWHDFETPEIHIVTSTKIKKTLKARVFSSAKQKYHHLWKWYNDKKFTFDATGARQELQNTEFSKSRLWMENTIFNLEQGYKWFVCHSKDKRLHTNLTNMNRELRKYLKYDGHSLQNIDINNSQIFFLLVLLHKIKNRKLQDTETESSIILELSSVSLCNKEFQSFHDLVVSGTFYKVLGERLMKEKGLRDYYIKMEYDYKSKKVNYVRFDNPKDLMKPIAFEILFSKNNHYTPEKKWFREQFPTIYKVIETIKSKNHNTLALLLQNLEAEAILDITVTKIKEFNKNIPIYTIHDSILTIPEHTNEVKRIMIESIFDFTGLKPSVSIE